eukprot:143280-Pelagomonas_calceolata.AAC.4
MPPKNLERHYNGSIGPGERKNKTQENNARSAITPRTLESPAGCHVGNDTQSLNKANGFQNTRAVKE